MSKEEKAREYIDKKYRPDGINKEWWWNNKSQEDEYWHNEIQNAYTAAEQDLSSQLTAYKEALRSMIIKYEQMLDCVEGVSHMRLDAYRDELTKAKTLIE